MQVLWFSFFPPLSFGLVSLIKVILLHLIFVLQAHPFQFPGPWEEEGGWLLEREESWAARRVSLQSLCHLTAVFTVVYRGERGACRDGAVVSQLKPFGGRLFHTWKTPALRFQAHT